jgi:hypothetical protein
MTTMLKLSLATTLVLSVGCVGANESPSSGAPNDASPAVGSLEGAWQLVELSRANGLSATNPPSLYLFGAGHYSIMYANTADRRRPFANPDSGTDAEIKEAWDTFIANAGSYSVAGDTLVIRPLIAKSPNYMGGGMDKFTMRVAGDTLWLRNVPQAFRWGVGPLPAPADTVPNSYRLVRLK